MADVSTKAAGWPVLSLLLGDLAALLDEGLGGAAALDRVGFAVLRVRQLQVLEPAREQGVLPLCRRSLMETRLRRERRGSKPRERAKNGGKRTKNEAKGTSTRGLAGPAGFSPAESVAWCRTTLRPARHRRWTPSVRRTSRTPARPTRVCTLIAADRATDEPLVLQSAQDVLVGRRRRLRSKW